MRTFVVCFTLLLISAAFKNDAADVAIFELQNGLPVSAIKSLSVPLTLAALLAAGWSARRALLSPRAPYELIALLACGTAIASFSSLYNETGHVAKILMSFLICVIVIVSVCHVIDKYGVERWSGCLDQSIFGFGAVLVAANFPDYVRGFGFVADNPRMFGSASHPNFFGVQLAICALAFLAVAMKSGRPALRIGAVMLMGPSLILLLATGSRTAMLMFGFGSALAIWVRLGLPAWVGFMAAALAVLSTFYVLGAVDLSGYSEVFARQGDVETRGYAWTVLLEAIGKSPLVGYGDFIDASENSLLRAAVLYGIAYALGVTLVICILLVIGIVRSECEEQIFSNTAGYGAAILVGSNLEGFLADMFSPIWLVAVMLIASTVIEGKRAMTARSTIRRAPA